MCGLFSEGWSRIEATLSLWQQGYVTPLSPDDWRLLCKATAYLNSKTRDSSYGPVKLRDMCRAYPNRPIPWILTSFKRRTGRLHTEYTAHVLNGFGVSSAKPGGCSHEYPPPPTVFHEPGEDWN